MSLTTSFEAEYQIATTATGLLDRSERGKLALTGPDAREFLHGQVTQDITGLQAGGGAYAAFLTPKGKMLGDLRVLDRGDELLLDTERSALQELFNMIRRYSLGYQVQIHKRTLECGLLSLIGPGSDQVLTAAVTSGKAAQTKAVTGAGTGTTTGAGVPGPDELQNLPATVAGAALLAIRTDLGLDLLIAADDVAPVRAALLDAGAAEIADAAAECLRIEHGRPRYGVDLDDTTIPQEAGLNERAVSFTKGCYVGQETVARLFYKGKPNRELRGLRSATPLAPGTVLTLPGDERALGTVTSATVSPTHGPLALALVRRQAPPGTTVSAGSQQAEVVELPFR